MGNRAPLVGSTSVLGARDQAGTEEEGERAVGRGSGNRRSERSVQ